MESVTSSASLIAKYNIQGPRYTSYPTVPYWESDTFTRQEWCRHVGNMFDLTNTTQGISLYIHLPFCESLCTYCGCTTRITVNHQVEIPYIKALLQEWEIYKRIFGRSPHIREIHLGGGTPTFFSPEHLFMLVDGIISGSKIADDAEFSFEGHPCNTTYEHLKTLYGCGFRRVSFGIQDFDYKVQEAINRYQSYQEVEQVTRWAREIGYTSINFDLVYGLPFQTEVSVANTIEGVLKLRPDRIAFYSYAHVPWLKPGQRKFTEMDLPLDDVKRALYENGRNLFEQACYKEVGMDHFSLQEDALYKAQCENKLHRNFMGYTTCATSMIIGLGASAISDTWAAFAQNSKIVEEYMKEVNNGNMPIFRGHILTEEDLILRKHILNIICRYETHWIDTANMCQALSDSIEALAGLIKDELVVVNEQGLKVTEKGKPFVRNICMAFDRRLANKELGKQVFSKVI